MISNVQAAHAGSYRVAANNDLGTSFSPDALLAVVPVAAWGVNSFGQTQVPADVGDIVAVAGGYGHSLGLRRDGTAVMWGTYQPNFSPIIGPPAFPLLAIAAASDHDVGLLPNGSVTVWGSGNLCCRTFPRT